MTSERHLTDEQIQDFVDGNIGSDFAAIAGHIEECARCRVAVDQYKALSAGLSVDTGPTLSADFAARVAARLHAAPDWTLALVAASIAAVAAVLVVVFGFEPILEFAGNLSDMQAEATGAAATAVKSFLARYNLTSTHIVFPIITLLFYLVIDSVITGLKRRGHALLSL